MKNLILALFMICAVNAFAASAPYKITNDNVKMGNGTTSSKGFEFDMGLGVLNPSFGVSNSSGFSLSKDLSIVGGLSASGVFSSTATGTHTFNGPLTTKAITSQGNTFTLGDGAASAKKIELNKGAGANNPYIAWDEAQSALTFSNDGTLVKKLGSGSGSGGDGGVNLLTNASFEDGAAFGWTNSGGTFTVASYTTGAEDNLKYAEFVATSASQTLCSNLASTPSYFGAGGMVDFSYTGTGSAFIAYVLDGSSNKLTANQALLDQTTWTKLLPIPFSLNSSQKLCFESTGAGTIKLDKTYLGSNKNVASSDLVFKTYTHAQVSVTGTGWTTTSGAFRPYIAMDKATNSRVWRMTFNVTGTTNSVATQTVTVSGVTFANMTQAISVTNNPANNVNSGSINAASGLSNLNGVSGVVATTWTFSGDVELAGKPTWADDINASTAQTPQASEWFIDANIGGGNPEVYVGSSYQEITYASLDMVPSAKNSASGIKIPCSGTNAPTGLTCSTGSESVGIVFTPPYTGMFEACFDFAYEMITGSAGSGSHVFQLVETGVSNQTIIQEGGSRIHLGGTDAEYVLNARFGEHLCGTFKFTSVEPKAIRLMNEGVNRTGYIYADRSGSFGQRDIHITVRPLLQNSLRAILTGDQVTAKGVKNPRDFTIIFGANSSGGPCTTSTCYSSSIGLNGNQSVIRNLLGNYTVSFGETFSSVMCVASTSNGAYGTIPNNWLSCTNCSALPSFYTLKSTDGSSMDSMGVLKCLGY